MMLGASSCAHSRSSLFGMLSGPIAIVMLLFFSSFWTASGEISIGLIFVLTCRVVGGISSLLDLVNAELNWFSRIGKKRLMQET